MKGHSVRPGMWKPVEQMYGQSQVELGKNSWKLKVRMRPHVSNLVGRIRSLASEAAEADNTIRTKKQA